MIGPRTSHASPPRAVASRDKVRATSVRAAAAGRPRRRAGDGRALRHLGELARRRRLSTRACGRPRAAHGVLRARRPPTLASAARVAIIGTRSATAPGLEMARRLGAELAEAGVAIVSGLARGIDGAAHAGALPRAGAAPPIGVVGSGLDVPYPRVNAGLWSDVARAGVLISEAPPGAPPSAWRFPARNRLIAALADLVVVVESRASGGSMLTVREAIVRGRQVMAVPGLGDESCVRGHEPADLRRLLSGPRRARRARRARAEHCAAARRGGRGRSRPTRRRPRSARAVRRRRHARRRDDRARCRAIARRAPPSRSTASSPRAGSRATARGGSPHDRLVEASGRYGAVMSWDLEAFERSLTSVAPRPARPTDATSRRSSSGPIAPRSTVPTRVDRTTLRRYLAYLSTRRYAPRTIARARLGAAPLLRVAGAHRPHHVRPSGRAARAKGRVTPAPRPAARRAHGAARRAADGHRRRRRRDPAP